MTVFNYWSETLECLVTLKDPKPFKIISVPDDGFVQSYNPKLTEGEKQVMVWLRPGDVRIIQYGIVTSEKGEFSVSVTGESMAASHTRIKTIKIIPYGIENYYNTPYMIDMLNSGALSIPDLNIPIDQRFVIPQADRLLYVPQSPQASVSLVGGTAGPSFTYGIWDTSTYLRTITNAGSVFANNLGINLLWLNFFRTQNAVDRKKIEDVHYGIADQIAQLMVYYTDLQDGSGFFSMWTSERPSLLVTISAVNTLASFFNNPEWLQQELYIDIGVVQNATVWICQQQYPTGAFGDNDVMFDMNLYKDLLDKNGNRLNVSYTAHVVVLLQEVYPHLTNSTVVAMARNALNLGLSYIALYVSEIDDPYILSHVALALRRGRHFNSNDALSKFMNMSRKGYL